LPGAKTDLPFQEQLQTAPIDCLNFQGSFTKEPSQINNTYILQFPCQKIEISSVLFFTRKRSKS